MRIGFVLVPLAMITTPALAQSAVPPPPPMAMPPQIADPMTIDRMGDVVEALSNALLDVPVGEVRAAIKGREPTLADKRETLGRETGVDGRQIHDQVQAAKPMIQHGAQAMARALPAILRSVAQVQSSIDRAMANMPDPNYPRR